MLMRKKANVMRNATIQCSCAAPEKIEDLEFNLSLSEHTPFGIDFPTL